MTTTAIAGSSQHSHPFTYQHIDISEIEFDNLSSTEKRAHLAQRTQRLLNSSSYSQGALKADESLTNKVRPYLAADNPIIIRTKASSGPWSSIATREAFLPIALLALHHVTYYFMSQQQTFLQAATQNTVGKSLTIQMIFYALEWAMAEGFRLVAEPTVANWKNAASKHVTEYAKSVNRNEMKSWAVNTVRDEINAAVGSKAAEDTQAAVQNVAQTFDNVMGLAVAALPLMLPITFGAGASSYTFASAMMMLWGVLPNLAGAAAGTFTLFYRKEEQSRLTQAEHRAQTKIDELTRNFADNIMIPNSLNQGLYDNALAAAQANRDGCTSRKSWHKFQSEALVTLLNGVSLMGLYIYNVHRIPLMQLPEGQFKILPLKLFQLNKIAHKSIALTNDVTNFVQNRDNLKNLKSSIDIVDATQWSNRLTQMFANEKHFTIRDAQGRARTLSNMLASSGELNKPGRWTIRARNGSGKSTLLNALTALRGNSAHYIPVKHELYHVAARGSAAETQIAQLAEVFGKSSASAIFLDEWPANLDANNTQRLDEILEQASKVFCIVEIRND